MRKILFILLLSLFSNSSFAYLFCKGTITDVWVDEHGRLYINGSWRSGHTQVCDIDSNWNGVSLEVCKAWLSISTAAQVSKAAVVVRYDDGDAESCSTLETYGNAPKPNYIMLDN